jgi:hypothetical protein
MKKVLLGVVLGAFGWQAYSQWEEPRAPSQVDARRDLSSEEFVDPDEGKFSAPPPGEPAFTCDGRTTCGQMTSCAEAEYFLRNCPDVEMDGNGDGEPCEMQWCGDDR